VTHAQTWAIYSAVYRFRSLSEIEYWNQNSSIKYLCHLCNLPTFRSWKK